MRKIRIAIDGPAASGKSTTARLLARKLGYIYIDTGAMYRAATLAVLENKVDINDEAAVENCIRSSKISIKRNNGEQHTFLNDKDVNNQIRTPRINEVISIISSYGGVRKILVAQQQDLAREGGVVMDGRDIGTVVLVDAELKVFMIASLQERAIRRRKELLDQGEDIPLSDVEAEISRRDKLDSGRSQAPLRKAAGALELDTSALSIEQQVDIILGWTEKLL